MGISIGKYRERVEFYNYTTTKDGYGQPVPTYTLYTTVWAQYKTLGGSESFESSEKTAKRFAEFWVRYQGLVINEAMRLKWNGMMFNITSIAQDEYKDYYVIRAVSKDND